MFFKYDACCASSRFNTGIIAEFEKKSTFGNLPKLNLNATPDRKFQFSICFRNAELVIIFLIIYCLSVKTIPSKWSNSCRNTLAARPSNFILWSFLSSSSYFTTIRFGL